MGIEPTQSAWKAEILPLNYTRSYQSDFSIIAEKERFVNSFLKNKTRVFSKRRKVNQGKGGALGFVAVRLQEKPIFVPLIE